MELARAIKGGTLELICPVMELLVCPSYHEVALRGAGVIRSDDLGRLYFRMVSPFCPTDARHGSLFGPKPTGELYPPRTTSCSGPSTRTGWSGEATSSV